MPIDHHWWDTLSILGSCCKHKFSIFTNSTLQSRNHFVVAILGTKAIWLLLNNVACIVISIFSVCSNQSISLKLGAGFLINFVGFISIILYSCPSKITKTKLKNCKIRSNHFLHIDFMTSCYKVDKLSISLKCRYGYWIYLVGAFVSLWCFSPPKYQIPSLRISRYDQIINKDINNMQIENFFNLSTWSDLSQRQCSGAQRYSRTNATIFLHHPVSLYHQSRHLVQILVITSTWLHKKLAEL